MHDATGAKGWYAANACPPTARRSREEMDMRCAVRLFGPSADSVGASEISVEIEGEATCSAVRRAIVAQYPGLERFVRAGRIAVNHAFAAETQRIRAGDEVALIAMVSGG
jgi:molybdopterin converting factor small subunit